MIRPFRRSNFKLTRYMKILHFGIKWCNGYVNRNITHFFLIDAMNISELLLEFDRFVSRKMKRKERNNRLDLDLCNQFWNYWILVTNCIPHKIQNWMCTILCANFKTIKHYRILTLQAMKSSYNSLVKITTITRVVDPSSQGASWWNLVIRCNRK